MAKLTLKEMQNLSELLLSSTESNVELGLQILENHKESVRVFCRELVLLWQLHKNEKIYKLAEDYLNKNFQNAQMNIWRSGFDIFRNFNHNYKYNQNVKKLIQNHENIRPDFQGFIEKNINYCLFYYAVAKKLNLKYKKHPDLAQAYYKIVLSSNPQHKKCLFYLAFLLHEEKNYEESMKYYKQAERIDPNFAALLNNIGILYEQKKEYVEAYNYYTKALNISPSSAVFLRNLATLCINDMQGEEYNQEAKILTEKLIKHDPESAFSWNTRADYFWKIEKNYEKAEKAYLKGLKKDSDNSWLLGNLGELYIDIYQQNDKGYPLYKKALEQQLTSYRLMTMISLLVNHYKNYAEAKDYYKKLIALSPDQKIVKDHHLTEIQWNDFILAEKTLKKKIQ